MEVARFEAHGGDLVDLVEWSVGFVSLIRPKKQDKPPHQTNGFNVSRRAAAIFLC